MIHVHQTLAGISRVYSRTPKLPLTNSHQLSSCHAPKTDQKSKVPLPHYQRVSFERNIVSSFIVSIIINLF